MRDRFILKSIDGKTVITLRNEEMVVGREATCDAVIHHKDISRRHARFRTSRDGVTVLDLGSTNGTSVNNRRISRETPVHPGDVVVLGTEAFFLQAPQDPDETLLSEKLSGVLEENKKSFVEDMFPVGGRTVMHQTFPMPPGWMDYDDEDRSKAPSSGDYSRQEIDALLAAQVAKSGKSPAALVVVSGSHKSRVVALAVKAKNKTWVIGRGGDADIRFSDAGMGRHHADLSYDSGRWRVLDKGSKNGVRINGKKVQEGVLADRDELDLGGVVMVFRTA